MTTPAPKPMSTPLAFGDVVEPIPGSGTVLRCGAGWYDCAVVISEDPPMLCSPGGDMLWCSSVADMKLRVVGKTDAHTLKRCMRRLPAKERKASLSALDATGGGHG